MEWGRKKEVGSKQRVGVGEKKEWGCTRSGASGDICKSPLKMIDFGLACEFMYGER